MLIGELNIYRGSCMTILQITALTEKSKLNHSRNNLIVSFRNPYTTVIISGIQMYKALSI